MIWKFSDTFLFYFITRSDMINGSAQSTTTTIISVDHLSKKLICSECGFYLSYFPIYQSKISKNKICGRCGLPPEDTAEDESSSNYVRVEIYEEVAQHMHFPCCYQEQGCQEIHVPADIPSHEESCRFRTTGPCPMQNITLDMASCNFQDTMNNTPMDVIIPTFVNPHLFWIIEKRQFLIRAAINKILSRYEDHQEIKEFHKMRQSTMVAVWVDGKWARARVHRLIIDTGVCKYLCWLLDYGIMRLQNSIFHLPGDLNTVPPIARQASLHNVVNLRKEWSSFIDTDCIFDLKKTAAHVEGTRNVSLDILESSNKLYFSLCDQDEFTLYGDILFSITEEEEKQSLTEYLVHNKQMAEDVKLFESIDASRVHILEEYYKGSQTWSKPLDKIIIDKAAVFFNTEENPFEYMEYFSRRGNSN